MTTQTRRPIHAPARFLSAAAILLAALALTGCGQRRAVTIQGPIPSSIDKQQADDYVNQADAALNAGDTDAALAAFAAAIEENPRIVRAHIGMTEIYKERKQWPEAEISSRKWVELEPRNYEARYTHGYVLHQLNRIVEAIREYRQALILEPNSHEANLNIATAYLQRNQPADALPFAQRAAKLEPNHGPTRANLGVIFANVGNHEKAVGNFEAAMELMEPSPELMLNLIESLRALARYPEMANATEALIRMQPSPDAYERLGYAQFKLRDYQASKDAYQAAIDLDGNYYPAMNGLAVNLLNDYIRENRTDQPSRQKAVELMRRSLQIHSDQSKIVELLSRYGR